MKAINRRKFLKSSLLGGVAATVIVKGKNANASATFGGYPDGMGVLVDLTGTFLAGASFLALLGIVIAVLILTLKISPEAPQSATPQ